jgi:hypothetical protein
MPPISWFLSLGGISQPGAHEVGVADAVADAVIDGVADSADVSVGVVVCEGVGDTVAVPEACDDEVAGVKVNKKIEQATRVNR